MLPTALSPAVSLRPYQVEGAESTLASLAEHRSVLTVMATGLGKTRTAKSIVRTCYEQASRVLWLVDTDDLVWQAAEALEEDPGPVPIDIEKARHKAEIWSPVVVGSVQTIRNDKRMRRFAREAFDLIVADEAHKSMSPGWERVFEYFHSAQVLGLTATPDRADRKSLRTFYEDVPYEKDIRDAVEDGWLVPLIQKLVRVDGLDYSEVRRQAMKLREGDMESALLNAEMIEQMAIPTRDLMGQRQNLIFTCSVDHAYAFRDFMRKLGIVTETVEGDQTRLPTKRRREIMEAFKRGDIQVLTNCACLTTGVDAPATSCITYARPMISRALYAQCAGRGTRPIIPHLLNDLMYEPAARRREAIANSAKPDCLLLDFLGNSGRLKLVRGAAGLDPDLDEETAEMAEGLAEEKQIPLLEALALAEEMRAELLKEVAKRDAKKASHGYSVTEVDPFEGSKCQKIFGLLGLRRRDDRWGLGSATDNQVAALKRWKVDDADILTRQQASDLLTILGKRKDAGLASYRMVELLVNVGKLPPDQVRRLPIARAKIGLDQLKANGWKRPERWGPVRHDRTGS